MPDTPPIFGPVIRGRSCGSCTFCCTAVPVEGLDKPAGVKCRFVKHKGCGIYPNHPDVCKAWSCRWLFDPDTADMQRPDKVGYCIDPTVQTILIDGEPRMTVQVWGDADRPEGHRDPALRAYLVKAHAKYKAMAIFRAQRGDLAGQIATALIPPAESEDGQWIEHSAPMLTRDEFTEKAIAAGGDEFTANFYRDIAAVNDLARASRARPTSPPIPGACKPTTDSDPA